jgi:hypothetical protein
MAINAAGWTRPPSATSVSRTAAIAVACTAGMIEHVEAVLRTVAPATPRPSPCAIVPAASGRS